MIEINQIQKIDIGHNHIVFKVIHRNKKLTSPMYEQFGEELLKYDKGIINEIDALNAFVNRVNRFISQNPEKFV